MSDPTIKPVVEEIEAILRKHNLEALIIIGSKTQAEFLYQLLRRGITRGLRVMVPSESKPSGRYIEIQRSTHG